MVDHTDVIAHLGSMGNPQPIIHNISHWGEATTDEMGVAKQDRLIQELANSDNWFDGKPDAILFSGGGNDIAGDRFCILLNYCSDKSPPPPPLNQQRLGDALGSVVASYLDLFDFRDHYAPDVPIFAHCYDFPFPDGRPACPTIGPWLSPSFEHCGWRDTDQNRKAVSDALLQFKAVLYKLANDSENKFFLVDTQCILASREQWANELHPVPDGFQKMAAKFLADLQKYQPFQGRI